MFMMITESFRELIAGRTRRLLLASILGALVLHQGSGWPALKAQVNPIVSENNQTGDTDWDISGAGDPSIQGFATDISVNTGATVSFKIKTDAPDYTIDIYRLWYYPS